jgi:aminoglycoside phosphotransferase (APT) family kinase protein/predicted DNA-binding transcriptional regulator AlpA
MGTEQGKPDPSAEWWTTSEVAAYLGLRVSTVSSYRMRGQMPEPDMTLGRTHVWRPSAIMNWHKQRPRPGVGGRQPQQPTGPDSEAEAAELTPDSAAAILRKACISAGLDPDGARLLRIGSNAVYHLAVPVVVRISRYGALVGPVQRSVAVARWLESIDFPAVRVVDVEQPLVIDNHAVTFWKAISDDGDQYATVREVAEVLVKLHALQAPASLALPPLAPFENAARRIDSNDWLCGTDREFLSNKLAELQDKYSGLRFELPSGVIHGDASIGNVLRDDRGNPVLIDLDGFAIGPREWDLVQTAMFYDSFGWHTREEYETFIGVYGFDITTWSGYPVLREVREFLMVTWLIQKAHENEATAAEASKRIESLRTGASRKDWKPY